ncbi:MAG: tRNA (N6-isopentenyl adenosine(37)-C2)-methylthiotransferase MiaB [Thermoguttaceae bacterium]
MTRRFYLDTVGCQMNVLDSELVAAMLVGAGYVRVDRPDRADLVLFNTCSVRQHAEDKIYSALGRLKAWKQQWPGRVLGVLGCMAQKDRERIFERAPHVDLVVGPGQLGLLPLLLDGLAVGGPPQIEVSLDRASGDRHAVRSSHARHVPVRDIQAASRAVPYQAMVRVMFGCDKFCSYCIVPSVRGPEQSRPADEIVDEVRRLADAGCVEVTLLGQTVNSYCDRSGLAPVRLADLLGRVHEIDGIRRLKFVTNHPRHMTDELLQAMHELPKVSPYLHVPAQSGSNAVLERMKRGYTVEAYREMLARIRQFVPGAAVTSDFIVGFCGETEAEFQETVELVRHARFKNSFIFKYSARPGTRAAELFSDDVPESVKRRRNNELLAVQDAISLEDNQPYLGRTVEVLVEGPSKAAKKRRRNRADDAARPHPNPLPPGEGTFFGPDALWAGLQDAVQLVGRTTCDRIVVFDGPERWTGRILPVAVEKIDAFTLFGKPVAP